MNKAGDSPACCFSCAYIRRQAKHLIDYESCARKKQEAFLKRQRARNQRARIGPVWRSAPPCAPFRDAYDYIGNRFNLRRGKAYCAQNGLAFGHVVQIGIPDDQSVSHAMRRCRFWTVPRPDRTATGALLNGLQHSPLKVR